MTRIASDERGSGPRGLRGQGTQRLRGRRSTRGRHHRRPGGDLRDHRHGRRRAPHRLRARGAPMAGVQQHEVHRRLVPARRDRAGQPPVHRARQRCGHRRRPRLPRPVPRRPTSAVARPRRRRRRPDRARRRSRCSSTSTRRRSRATCSCRWSSSPTPSCSSTAPPSPTMGCLRPVSPEISRHVVGSPCSPGRRSSPGPSSPAPGRTPATRRPGASARDRRRRACPRHTVVVAVAAMVALAWRLRWRPAERAELADGSRRGSSSPCSRARSATSSTSTRCPRCSWGSTCSGPRCCGRSRSPSSCARCRPGRCLTSSPTSRGVRRPQETVGDAEALNERNPR